jgi:elongator complex protein 3
VYPDRFFEEVLRRSKEEMASDKDRFQLIKKDACIGLALDRIPSDADVAQWILESDLEEEYGWLLPLLRIKRTRTLSGVAPVAVMTSPADCPHGKCICCPGGTANNTPQSYTGQEPAALRAGQHAYDPQLQVANRLEQLKTIGHSTDKVDLIIMGGTFTARDPDYQRGFVKGCLDGLNGAISQDLETAQARNELAPHRCIGMTVETRPDWFKRPHIGLSLELGATRVSSVSRPYTTTYWTSSSAATRSGTPSRLRSLPRTQGSRYAIT